MEFINQQTNGRKEEAAAEKYELVGDARIIRSGANLCYCLFNVCVPVRVWLSPFASFAALPNTNSFYRWHKNLFPPRQRETERGILSGLIFLSPDLIFIFVSVVCFLVIKHHCIRCQRRIDLKWFFLVSSSVFCLIFSHLLTVTTTWSGCSNRKCCSSSPHP